MVVPGGERSLRWFRRRYRAEAASETEPEAEEQLDSPGGAAVPGERQGAQCLRDEVFHPQVDEATQR